MPAVMQSAPTPVQVGHLADPTIILLEEGETMHRMLQSGNPQASPSPSAEVFVLPDAGQKLLRVPPGPSGRREYQSSSPMHLGCVCPDLA